MNFCHSFLYWVMLFLNANTRTFNLYVGLLKLYHLYFAAYTYICILFLLNSETLHKTNSTVFILLLDTYIFC